MTSGLLDPRQFEIVAPVWVESIADDDLMAFDPDTVEAKVSQTLIGFVAIRLDFVLFHDQLLIQHSRRDSDSAVAIGVIWHVRTLRAAQGVGVDLKLAGADTTARRGKSQR